jgi:DNA modification methylase
MQDVKIYQGDALEILRELPSESIQCCVTSPPYYGLRDYGTGEWVGGDKDCPHMRTTKISENTQTGHKSMYEQGQTAGDAIYKSQCPECGAVRVDQQIGLEETPEAYVHKLVAIFREVKRVLRNDGTIWLNLGDSYVGGNYRGSATNVSNKQQSNKGTSNFIATKAIIPVGYKAKDLYGIPWRVAFALQADGWYLRQDIIWSKPNPMPESVKDRCTKSHEYMFLLSKSSQYYFDHEAIKEECSASNIEDFRKRKTLNNKGKGSNTYEAARPDLCRSREDYMPKDFKRNKRSVWNIPTKPYKEAHFATFPPALIEPCILAGCPEGETVLDPFMGSGTTALVAYKLGRKAIGCELNPEYIEIANKRLKPVTDQLSLFAS